MCNVGLSHRSTEPWCLSSCLTHLHPGVVWSSLIAGNEDDEATQKCSEH